MKIKTLIIVLVLTAFGRNASAQETFDKWPALGEFHEIMSQTFHPMEEGNFEPIKTRCGEMVTKAKNLASSKIPTEFQKAGVKEAIQELVDGSERLNRSIAKASNADIKTVLTSLHESFHKIVGLCREPAKKEAAPKK